MNKTILYATISLIIVVSMSLMIFTFVLPKSLPNLGKAVDFSLTDENGNNVTLKTYSGKVLIIDFIYTQCPDPNFCPLSTSKMNSLESKIIKAGYSSNDVQLISISFDYKYDGPIQMKQYEDTWSRNKSYWSFLSGNISVLEVAGAYGVFAFADEEYDTETAGDFLPIYHNMSLTIVDKEGYIRAKHMQNKWTSAEVFAQVASLI